MIRNGYQRNSFHNAKSVTDQLKRVRIFSGTLPPNRFTATILIAVKLAPETSRIPLNSKTTDTMYSTNPV
jgi:hypothetical protein